MIIWMIYVVAVTLLLSGAAFAAEQGARLRRASSRWTWALAIVLSLLIPTIIASVSVQIPNIPSIVTPAVSRKIIALREVTSARLSPLSWMGGGTAAATAWPRMDRLIQRSWMALSAAMLLGLMISGTHLFWRKRRWSQGTVGGMTVYIAPDIGPAVVGLLRPRIVVPAWLTQSSDAHQSAVIAHEQSHLDARDPLLLTVLLCLLVLMPWNVPLWWQMRRLRYAIEVDCDRRVLKSGYDAILYGETLIAVGQRKSAYIGAVAAMSESRSFLEERIQIMVKQPAKWWRASATALGCLSLALVAVAAEVSPPNADGVGGNTHQEIALDSKLLDGYVGPYQFGDSAVMTVTRDGQHLFAQLTGQQAFQIYPESDSQFFYKVVNAQISFVADPQGGITSLVLHQNGRNITMPRIEPAVAKQIASQIAAKVQSQTPTAGSETALRRIIAGIVSGQPNYDEMSPELAQTIRQQLPKLQAGMAAMGAVQSVEFRGVGNAGWDRYDVKQEHGSSQWSIALDTNGIITSALVTAAP